MRGVNDPSAARRVRIAAAEADPFPPQCPQAGHRQRRSRLCQRVGGHSDRRGADGGYCGGTGILCKEMATSHDFLA